jgi:hypothetical protein
MKLNAIDVTTIIYNIGTCSMFTNLFCSVGIENVERKERKRCM